jgi:carboxyl-terminal processing protease
MCLTDPISQQFSNLRAYLPAQARWLLILALFVFPGQNTADTVKLKPSPTHERTIELINYFVQRYHYRTTTLNDALSSQILDRFIESMDANRSFFVSDDIEKFEQIRFSIDDYLRNQNLEPIYGLFELYRTRVEERLVLAEQLLDRGFELDIDENYRFDRTEAPWAIDRVELADIWRKRVKNDYLSLSITGKPHTEIVQTLGNRYRQLGRRTSQVNEQDVFQTFINAYVSSVDPHSSYFSPRATENFKIRMSLSLEGIGAVLQSENEYTVVRRVVAGGPAEMGDQLHSGDRIIGVGQGLETPIVDVIGWRLDDVVDLIRGPKGTSVRLQILPEDDGPDSPGKVISIVRDTIKLEEQAAQKSVITVHDGNQSHRVGIINLPTFYVDFDGKSSGQLDYRSTTRDVVRLVSELESEGIIGLVIDLRGNGGGALSEATSLTGLFIEKGPIVQVKDAKGRIRVKRDRDSSIAYSGPLVVVVDQDSASASEIFAGAIQDYRRGVVVGEHTFGKGTVQNLIDLDRYARNSDERLGQLKFTIAQFYRINGDSTQHRGVIPDIVFPMATPESQHGERSLQNALPWNQVDAARFTPFESARLENTLSKVRNQHEHRTETDPGFRFLLSNLQLDAELAGVKKISLLQSRRTQERNTRQDKRDKFESVLRTARGKDPSSAFGKDKEFPGDILLVEAARIVVDTAIELSEGQILAQSNNSTAGRSVSTQDR